MIVTLKYLYKYHIIVLGGILGKTPQGKIFRKIANAPRRWVVALLVRASQS